MLFVLISLDSYFKLLMGEWREVYIYICKWMEKCKWQPGARAGLPQVKGALSWGRVSACPLPAQWDKSVLGCRLVSSKKLSLFV